MGGKRKGSGFGTCRAPDKRSTRPHTDSVPVSAGSVIQGKRGHERRSEFRVQVGGSCSLNVNVQWSVESPGRSNRGTDTEIRLLISVSVPESTSIAPAR